MMMLWAVAAGRLFSLLFRLAGGFLILLAGSFLTATILRLALKAYAVDVGNN